MSRTLKLIGIVLFGAAASTAYACGGGDDGGGGSSTGGSGGKGGSGGSGGSTEGGSCGPTTNEFTGECKSGAPPECCDATIPVMKKRDSNDNLIAPDWSCITGGGGTGGVGIDSGLLDGGLPLDAGAGDGATAQNVFVVEDFSSSKPVADIEVELYEGESVIGKTPFISEFTKGTEHPGSPELNIGEFYFPHPATGLVSYRVKEKVGVAKEFVGFGEAVPAPPGKVTGNTLSPTLYNQLAQFAVPLVGWKPPEDLAIVTGPVRDCAGDDVGGARIKFIDEDTGAEIQPGTCERDTRYIYFDGQYPNPKCAYTDYRQSLWIIANAVANASGPGAGRKFRVEHWGRLTDSDTEPVKFAEKSIDIFANTVNVHQIRPNVTQ